MKIINYFLGASLFILTSCGPDSDLVANGIIHQCDIIKLERQLEEDPNNVDVQKQLIEKIDLLEITIENEDEGKRDDLKKAILEGTKDC